MIPGATVTARNVETGISRAVTSDATGRYRVPQLAVGTYEITAESAGFQTLIRSGITLTIGREAVVDFSLQVGAVSEKITVTGEAPLLETTKAEVSGLVSEKQMQDLPLNGRSYANLATIQAGVVTDFMVNSNIERGGQAFVALGPKMSINGSRPNQAMYLLDGTEITTLRYNNIPGSMAGQLLGVEAVREFTILKNNYGAQYGRGVGGIMNAVTRAGTNDIHGSLFEFFRNSKLDAKNFFDAGDQPIPPFRKNQFGASIGGPIIKDHAFFMGSYEGIRELVGLTGISTVPTLQTRAGLGPVFGNPATPVAKNKDIQPFLDLIPLSDPQYDLGNGFGRLKTWRRRPISEDNGVIRYDQQLTSKDSLFARLSLDRSSNTSYGSGFIPGYSLDGIGRYYYVTIGETRILSSTLLNDFRAGFSRNVNITDEHIPALDPRLGIFPGSPLTDWSIGGMSVAGKIGSGFQEPDHYIDNTFDFSDNVLINRGRHSITVGVNVKRYRGNDLQDIWAGGVMSFTNFAGFYRTGSVASTVSLGVPGTWVEEQGWRQTYWATYLQDDFRATSNLTVNLGVRLERITDPKESHDRVATILNPCCDSSTHLGYPWITIHDPLKLLSPRVGLAWSPFGNQKNVVRAGYGIFKEPVGEYLYALYYYVPPIATVYFQNPTIAPIPFPYPLGSLVTDPASLGKNIGSYVFVEPNVVQPFTQQWNFAIQRQLSSSLVVTATYIGSIGKHLTTISNMNQFVPVMKFDPTVGYDRWYTPGAGEAGFGQRQNPNFTGYRMETFAGRSWYNALQMELDQKYSNGLQYNVSYTWGKNLADVGYAGAEGQQGATVWPQNWYDRSSEKGLSTINVAHNFIVSTTYELPVGQGKKFGGNMGKIGESILGGWSFNTILRRRTGLPASPTIAFNNSRSGGVQGSGSISERADLIPNGDNNPILGGPDKYFDPTQWVVPPPGRYGNAGTSTIVGPGLLNMDFSLFKGFRVAEGKQLQFRAEFFNLTNHPSFGQPNSGIFTSATSRNATAGQISETQTTSRQIQLALKLTF